MSLLSSLSWNVLSLFFLLAGTYLLIEKDPSFLMGEWQGRSTLLWFGLALIIPILHQLYVLVCWRWELYRKGLTRALGGNAFVIYKVGFVVLFASRLLAIAAVALANINSLALQKSSAYLLAVLFFIPALYLFYSVKKYFSYDRAFGIDHFEPEKYRNAHFVREGIFRLSSNAMYVFGFLILWVPGFLFMSKAALLAAIFNHLYIWVHYFFTELPDIRVIYTKD